MDKDKTNKNFSPLDKGDDDMNVTIDRYCTVAESLEESLKQMKLIREGKLPKKTWKELRDELKSDKE
jgi:hypothetical protein